MQISTQFVALVATVILALSSADARPVRRNPSGMVTLPMRLVQRNQHLPVEIRHQQHINRAERLVARAAGLEGPSDVQLRINLARRESYLSLVEKRFNIPPPDYGLPAGETDGIVSNVVEENDATSEGNATLAPMSSEVEPDGPDTSFLVTVPIGTPSRDFNIILDSGSGDFWVESSTNCTSQNGGGCGNHTFLGEDNSASLVNTRQPFSDSYGSGAASGDIITDTIVLGGMVLGNHSFGLANIVSQSFSGDLVADGLMGLGKQGLSAQKVLTPVQSLRNAGFISAAITSYQLPRSVDHTDGEVTFGALDDTKFDESTLVTLEATNDAFWITQLGGVTVDGATVALSGNRTALMDTGTTLLVVPSTDIAGIHAKIPGAKQTSSGSFTVPCNTNASVALEFGGKSFPINPQDLTFASGGRTTGDCTSGIGAFAPGQTPTQWLVGGSFLKSVYFSTNVDANTITLAQPV
ncbi:acid protease [Mycena maculata]|uniref:Acid protease n=1 Tax=Mycena maculata TaxID=230809 RepID=A0AAD7ML87_9AGAR|nr:acid protease [Mycena maculata]